MAKGSGQFKTFSEDTAAKAMEAAGIQRNDDGSFAPAEEDEKADNTPDADDVDPDESDDSSQSDEVDASTDQPDDSDPDADEGEEDDVPTEWLDVKFLDEDGNLLSKEARQAILSHIKENDEYARSLERRLASQKDGEDQPEDDPDEGQPQEVDIDSVLDNLYGKPDDDDPESLTAFRRDTARPVIESMLPVLQQQQQMIQELTQVFIEGAFETEVAQLEGEFGVEVDREVLLDTMEKQNIQDVEAAYHKLTARSRRSASTAVEQNRKKKSETEKREAKRAVASSRPRRGSVEDKAPPTNLTPLEAGNRALKKLGLDR